MRESAPLGSIKSFGSPMFSFAVPTTDLLTSCFQLSSSVPGLYGGAGSVPQGALEPGSVIQRGTAVQSYF